MTTVNSIKPGDVLYNSARDEYAEIGGDGVLRYQPRDIPVPLDAIIGSDWEVVVGFPLTWREIVVPMFDGKVFERNSAELKIRWHYNRYQQSKLTGIGWSEWFPVDVSSHWTAAKYREVKWSHSVSHMAN